MGWDPRPHFDRQKRRWYCRVARKKHDLGTDYADAWRRFADLYARAYGAEPDEGQPQSVAGLVKAWLDHNPGDWFANVTGDFVRFAGKRPIADISDQLLRAYAAWLKNAPQTIRQKVFYARRVAAWAVERGWIVRVPAMPKLARAAKAPKDLTPAQVRRLDKQLSSNERLRPAQTVVEFILTTGCRPGEACKLDWKMVDLDRGVCQLRVDVDRATRRLRGHKTAAHGKTRTIYLSPEAIRILKTQRRRDGKVFHSRLGKPYTVAGLRSILRRLGVKPYQLRHTFAQNALDQTSMEDVSKLLGHSDLRMIQIYAQVRSQRAMRVIKTIDSPLKRARKKRQRQAG